MSVYYNEIDPYCVAWLRNLIAAGYLPAGDVDERSIVDVQPDDLIGYRQVHLFCGLSGWAYAARLAGWPDDRELWTGSPPCQPFSVAGKQRGTDDPRHLWPHYLRLVRARRPAVLMGEQVAAAVGHGWLDGVLADLEGIGYACRAVVVPACAIDAPHRRDRLWFVAHTECARSGREVIGREVGGAQAERSASRASRPGDGAVDHGERAGLEGHPGDGNGTPGRSEPDRSTTATGCGCDVADASGERRQQIASGAHGHEGPDEGRSTQYDHIIASVGEGTLAHADESGSHACAHPRIHHYQESGGPRDGESVGHRTAWHGADWITGHDGKARRIPDAQSGVCPLAYGISARVGKLRAYGNAIVPQVAAEVIAAWMECAP